MSNKALKKIPVILDTDIGSDIDDTWAIVMMLNCPELDVKLIVTESGNTVYRAQIVAKILEAAGRTDIPIGIGIKTVERLSEKWPDVDIPIGIGIKGSDEIHSQGKWIEGYRLDDYPGTVYEDGIGAMINTIMGSDEELTLIAIGPVTNVAAALDREPAITSKCRYVGMQGSIRKGDLNSDEICAEFNTSSDSASCRKVFEAPWDVTITPLDTCGIVRLTGAKYEKVLNCHKPEVVTLIENYKVWDEYVKSLVPDHPYDFHKESTVLFDTVAVYLAFSEELLEMEEIGVRVTDDGYTIIDDNAKKIRCAVGWKSLNEFEDLLLDRLT